MARNGKPKPSPTKPTDRGVLHQGVRGLFIEPTEAVERAEQRREGRLLSTLLVFLNIQAVIGVAFVLFADQSVPPLENPFLYVAIITILSFIVAYGLSRTPHYRIGATIVIICLPVLIYAAVLTTAGTTATSTELLVWYVMAILIGSMFFSVRLMMAFAISSIAALLTLPLVSEAITYRGVLIPFIFISIMSTLVLVWANHRNLVEQDRQAELAESEKRYRTLLETSFDGIILHDNDILLDANTGFAHMFGYEMSEVIGRPLSEFAVSGSGNKAIAEAIASGVKQVHETRGIKRSGQIFDIEVVGKIQPYRGRLVQMTAVRDISKRKRAESAERSQRRLAEAMRDTTALLTSTLNLDEVFDRILTNIGHVVPHVAANIMLIENGVIHIVRSTGYEEHYLEDDPLDYQDIAQTRPSLWQMLETGEPIVIPDTKNSTRWIETEHGWVRSYVGAPIRLEGKVIGFINLDSGTPNFFQQRQAEHLQTFADQSAVALRNARLYQELETYSERLEVAVEQRTGELRRTKERVETILNNSPDAVLLLANDGAIRVTNPAFSQMFGYGVDEVFNWHPAQLAAPESGQTFNTALEAVITNCKPQRLELIARRKDGSTFDADVALAPIVEYDESDGMVCSLRDISALKEVERMKDVFVSNVSHELRTPITNLKLYQKMLALNKRPEKHQEYLRTLERETERLSRIIEDLLQLSRLDQKHVPPPTEPVDINELVCQHVTDRQLLAERANVTLFCNRSSPLPHVPADEGLLGQVLGILLTNAINYTPPGGSVSIFTETRHSNGREWVCFSVSDTGPGIPPSEQAHVFERFFRGKAGLESGAPGTGLGLSIARSIVEQYHGRITFTCAEPPETGTTFDVWLPADSV